MTSSPTPSLRITTSLTSSSKFSPALLSPTDPVFFPDDDDASPPALRADSPLVGFESKEEDAYVSEDGYGYGFDRDPLLFPAPNYVRGLPEDYYARRDAGARESELRDLLRAMQPLSSMHTRSLSRTHTSTHSYTPSQSSLSSHTAHVLPNTNSGVLTRGTNSRRSSHSHGAIGVPPNRHAVYFPTPTPADELSESLGPSLCRSPPTPPLSPSSSTTFTNSTLSIVSDPTTSSLPPNSNPNAVIRTSLSFPSASTPTPTHPHPHTSPTASASQIYLGLDAPPNYEHPHNVDRYTDGAPLASRWSLGSSVDDLPVFHTSSAKQNMNKKRRMMKKKRVVVSTGGDHDELGGRASGRENGKGEGGEEEEEEEHTGTFANVGIALARIGIGRYGRMTKDANEVKEGKRSSRRESLTLLGAAVQAKDEVKVLVLGDVDASPIPVTLGTGNSATPLEELVDDGKSANTNTAIEAPGGTGGGGGGGKRKRLASFIARLSTSHGLVSPKPQDEVPPTPTSGFTSPTTTFTRTFTPTTTTTTTSSLSADKDGSVSASMSMSPNQSQMDSMFLGLGIGSVGVVGGMMSVEPRRKVDMSMKSKFGSAGAGAWSGRARSVSESGNTGSSRSGSDSKKSKSSGSGGVGNGFYFPIGSTSTTTSTADSHHSDVAIQLKAETKVKADTTLIQSHTPTERQFPLDIDVEGSKSRNEEKETLRRSSTLRYRIPSRYVAFGKENGRLSLDMSSLSCEEDTVPLLQRESLSSVSVSQSDSSRVDVDVVMELDVEGEELTFAPGEEGSDSDEYSPWDPPRYNHHHHHHHHQLRSSSSALSPLLAHEDDAGVSPVERRGEEESKEVEYEFDCEKEYAYSLGCVSVEKGEEQAETEVDLFKLRMEKALPRVPSPSSSENDSAKPDAAHAQSTIETQPSFPELIAITPLNVVRRDPARTLLRATRSHSHLHTTYVQQKQYLALLQRPSLPNTAVYISANSTTASPASPEQHVSEFARVRQQRSFTVSHTTLSTSASTSALSALSGQISTRQSAKTLRAPPSLGSLSLSSAASKSRVSLAGFVRRRKTEHENEEEDADGIEQQSVVVSPTAPSFSSISERSNVPSPLFTDTAMLTTSTTMGMYTPASSVYFGSPSPPPSPTKMRRRIGMGMHIGTLRGIKEGMGIGGPGKKRLVVSGIVDERGYEAVKAWCESFGQVRSFDRKEDGKVVVDWKKASVAETVCRVQAKVHIRGAGSVSLSWFSKRK